jgi:hypothetical protein
MNCTICQAEYIPKYKSQTTCLDPVCKKEQKRQQAKAREERRAILARKEKLKTRSDYMKEAQRAFNAFIRERDKHEVCICCGLPLNSNGQAPTIGGGYDCGHYRSVGSAPHLRFDERNAHAQRKQCNRWGSGRAVDYRIGLIRRIGLAEVEALESDQTVKKYTAEDLNAIRDAYKMKLKALKRHNHVR